jgi:hypothetical protein
MANGLILAVLAISLKIFTTPPINSLLNRAWSLPGDNKSLRMPFLEYSKPLGANEFGACRAVSLAQLRPNVQNCSSPLSYVFNPLLYRLSYQAKNEDYSGTVFRPGKWALLCLLWPALRIWCPILSMSTGNPTDVISDC